MKAGPLLPRPRFLTLFPPAVAKTYIDTFRSHNDDRPSKFIVVADNMKSAINVAWEHGGADFQLRFDKIHRTGTGNERRGAAGSVKDDSLAMAAHFKLGTSDQFLVIPFPPRKGFFGFW